MPNHRTPDELVAAATDHVASQHQLELRPDEIGRPTARKSTVRLTWAREDELGLYFVCRRCPEGFGRYCDH